MILLNKQDLTNIFKDKTVAIIGSSPKALECNTKKDIDNYDLIIRVNNYKTKGLNYRGVPYDYINKVGSRVDYHYSFYGGSIRKSQEDLKADNIKGHLCKCPNDECHVTDWHKRNNQIQGGDFRPLYRRRHDFWIVPVYIPTKEHYMKIFHLLGDHVPSTGFACIWEIMLCEPKLLYITGFDFMTSGQHNIDEVWRSGKQDDPIRHMWGTELNMVKKWTKENNKIKVDTYMQGLFNV